MKGLLDVRPDSDYCDMGADTITLFEPVNQLLDQAGDPLLIKYAGYLQSSLCLLLL